jgi:hypothetical protein
MTTNQTRVLIAAGAIALIALAVGLFFFAFERVEKTVREFPSGEAVANPYLALERLSESAGIATETYRHLDYPDSGWVIFLADPATRPPPERVENWADWVEQRGGHLVLSVPDGDRDEITAPLVARLGFQKFEDAPISSDAAATQLAWPDDATRITYDFVVSTIFDDHATSQPQSSETNEKPEKSDAGLEISSTLRGWLATDADWLALDESGLVVAASRTAGAGRITLISWSSYFDNLSIGGGENATAAIDILRLPVPAAADWNDDAQPRFSIALYGERESWMAYVLSFTWPYFLTLMILLLLAIQQGRRRFGPMLADPPPERRSRLEHIGAVGRFFWQRDATASLVEATQESLLRALERRSPELRHAQGARRWELIAELLRIDAASARRLFQPPTSDRHADRFIAKIRTLETYRRQL